MYFLLAPGVILLSGGHIQDQGRNMRTQEAWFFNRHLIDPDEYIICTTPQ